MNDEGRFAFGENWRSFLSTLDEDRIATAVDSLRRLLDVSSLEGKRFLDLGCGSGLFSLAAHRLGAEVISIDYDETSVACTEHLRQRFAEAAETWTVRQGSVLDAEFMGGLQAADVVYSWGVLHHTGSMDRAIRSAADRVTPGGMLAIAIYNDQGRASRRWLAIKQTYNRLPGWLRPAWVCLIAGYYELKFAAVRLLRGRNPLPMADWRAKKKDRGMSAWHDWVDWVGGLPFEVATPDSIVDQLDSLGFTLREMRKVGKGWGCNEYVFERRIDH